MATDCIFCKIVRGEIPARKIYEDDDVLAFHDINPQAPLHALVIPKKHIDKLSDAQPEDQALLGKMALVASQVAAREGSTDGFRTLINVGRIGQQDVYHLHQHVLGGDQPLGPILSRRAG